MLTRRSFLKTSSAAALSLTIVPRHVLGQGQTPPSAKLNLASIGVGSQGGGLLGDAALNSQNLVAICDVDASRKDPFLKRFPGAKFFRDYREMLGEVKDLDAVIVATPDHQHAPVTLRALRAGKHVYVEKPMAHSIEEARLMTQAAKASGLVTQMGNMGHGGEGIRQTREWIAAGVIGPVTEVHCWTDRPGKWWPQPVDRPTATPPVPKDLDWDLWLGPAPARPYHPAYLPVKWRAFFDFGTGATGDMAVHNLDPAFYALDLLAPTAVSADTSPLPADTYPAWQIITFEFAAAEKRPAVKLVWYDSGKLPERPKELDEGFDMGDNGIYFRGEKGVILCGGWSGPPRLFPRLLRKDFVAPPKSIPRSPGHRAEWVQAIRDRKPESALAGFAYSGPFTEALFVGALAVRLQKRIEWDSANLKATNAPEAEGMIRKTYRAGFGLV